MATSRSESELQFNGTSAADFRLTQSPFAKNWPSTCKQSFPSRSLAKTKKHIGGGNWSLEGFREPQCPLRGLGCVKTGALPQTARNGAPTASGAIQPLELAKLGLMPRSGHCSAGLLQFVTATPPAYAWYVVAKTPQHSHKSPWQTGGCVDDLRSPHLHAAHRRRARIRGTL